MKGVLVFTKSKNVTELNKIRYKLFGKVFKIGDDLFRHVPGILTDRLFTKIGQGVYFVKGYIEIPDWINHRFGALEIIETDVFVTARSVHLKKAKQLGRTVINL